jgi:uncharacterized protein YegP (UPF0339 family)
MDNAKIEFRKVGTRRWIFQIRHVNYRVIFRSQEYVSKAALLKGIENLKATILNAEIEETEYGTDRR